MEIGLQSLTWDKLPAEDLVLPLFSDTPPGTDFPHMPASWRKMVDRVRELKDFEAKEGQLEVLYPEQPGPRRLVLLGLGESGKFNGFKARKVAGKMVGKLRDLRVGKAAAGVPVLGAGVAREDYLRAFAEGAITGEYDWDKYKTGEGDKKPHVETLTLVSQSPVQAAETALLKRVETLETITAEVRDLVNDNSDVVTPTALMEKAKAIASEFGMKVTILDRDALEAAGCGLILSVAAGNAEPPYLIILEYDGKPKDARKTAVVGKGITFDTGGLNIKPEKGMITMRCDMAGAAVTLGTLKAAAALTLPVNLVGVVPTCENAISGTAYKPGDVMRACNGVTVEMTHTDAEGRLVLGDALAYSLERFKPTEVIDLATLTGSIIGALGYEAAGVMGNDQALITKLIAAGERTGERLWQLPLWEEFKEYMKSDIADIRNDHGVRDAGSIVGGIFLQRFVGNVPWAHLDIAATAWMNKPKGPYGLGATGYGVRLLTEYLMG